MKFNFKYLLIAFTVLVMSSFTLKDKSDIKIIEYSIARINDITYLKLNISDRSIIYMKAKTTLKENVRAFIDDANKRNVVRFFGETPCGSEVLQIASFELGTGYYKFECQGIGHHTNTWYECYQWEVNSGWRSVDCP